MKRSILHTFGCIASLAIVLAYIVLPTQAENPTKALTDIRQLASKDSLSRETRDFIMRDVYGGSIRTREQIFHDLGVMYRYNQLHQKSQPAILDYLIRNKDKFLSDISIDGYQGIDIYLETYLNDDWASFQLQREKELREREEKHLTTLLDLPEDVEIPTPKASDTYQAIVVDISQQRLFAFEDGLLIASSPITSGKRGYGTVTGDFKVLNKKKGVTLKSPFSDPKQYYSLHVDYWINFYKGYGIHDACNSRNCWRTQFGGQDYISRGSHGCVNTPYDFVAWVYDWALVNTRVSVQG